jgi:hypothetical protein
MTPTCLKLTNFRATIRKTKVALKSTRILEKMVSKSPSTKQSPSSTRELKNVTLTSQTPLWCGVQECVPGPSQNSLETGASWALPRACQCDGASTSHARLQLGRKLPLSNPALHSANAEQEKA